MAFVGDAASPARASSERNQIKSDRCCLVKQRHPRLLLTPLSAPPHPVPVPPQVSRSTGYFELQLVSLDNPGGQLLSGDCCDSAEGPCGSDGCDTYFKVCLKEYQTEVVTRGTCTYGSETTKVIGGNTFQFKSGAHRNEAGKILIRFQFAWPVSGFCGFGHAVNTRFL